MCEWDDQTRSWQPGDAYAARLVQRSRVRELVRLMRFLNVHSDPSAFRGEDPCY